MTAKLHSELEERRARMSDAEIEAFYAEMKREGLLIDPETAEVLWEYGQVVDPYGIHPDLWDEYFCVGREYFARRPGSDIWVSFGDLPAETCEKLWKHPNAKPSFTVETNGELIWNIDIDLPEGLEPPF